MTEDLPLWSLSRLHDSETSYKAGANSRAMAKAQASCIILMLQRYGELTNDQMDEAAGWDKGTAGKRKRDVNRLLNGSGLAYATTGKTKLTRRGHQADIWCLRKVNSTEEAA